MEIFVGSLPFKMQEKELREIFEKYGEVLSAKIIIDHQTRQNKGFGFVKMPDDNQARHAIAELNGVEVEGRPLVVNEAQFRKGTDRPGAGPAKPAERPERRPFQPRERETPPKRFVSEPKPQPRPKDYGASKEDIDDEPDLGGGSLFTPDFKPDFKKERGDSRSFKGDFKKKGSKGGDFKKKGSKGGDFGKKKGKNDDWW
ncbi:hypothetical protein GCM10027275_11390 [Rhabdobacter roseus]|uniref:RNA recognition motif-containing protein n=1 Tax=Rhabdobacter roseus TaxID=1655419 RepID=A0A840TIA5_9BACT|nr:RNA-binding protein [Rhabdobacter roseus]MBB5283051.1 RNA recognition motif-containing protein [Rhabdobacter roseus]